jgi:hypothetical protein
LITGLEYKNPYDGTNTKEGTQFELRITTFDIDVSYRDSPFNRTWLTVKRDFIVV